MRWGRLPANRAGQVMIDALGDRSLSFVSVGRLTLIWEAKSQKHRHDYKRVGYGGAGWHLLCCECGAEEIG